MIEHQIDEVGLLSQIPHLQAEVERLRGELVKADLWEHRWIKEIERHKEALEKAKVAMVALQGDAVDPHHRELLSKLADSGVENAKVGLLCLDALATINEVLAK